MSETEINDYLSKCDKDLANNVIYRVYGMPGPIFMEKNNDTPTPEPPTPPTPPAPDPTIPFYIEDVSGSDNTISIIKSGSQAPTLTIQKSLDGVTWESMGSTSQTAITATVPANGKLYLRCNTNNWGMDYSGMSRYNYFSGSTGNFNVGGNIMSLLYGDSFNEQTEFKGDYKFIFSNLFQDRNIVSAANLLLPATTLYNQCYYSMFKGCTALTTAPSLPATTLANGCYGSMFNGCTSLTTAPALPVTTLTDSCYFNMFYNCTSLTTAPELPATILVKQCYCNMFSGCTSLTTSPALPAATLDQQCYFGMFKGCTSLTTAPATLPATTLAQECYREMFQNCTSLTTAPATLPATTLIQQCYQNMFYGCESLTTAPELPATTLVQSCYLNMFSGCTDLNYVKCLATNISATECLYRWTYGVSATGTFVKNPDMSGWTTGTNGIPEGWTVEDYS